MYYTRSIQTSVLILILLLSSSITFLSLEPTTSFAKPIHDKKLTVITYNIYQGSRLQDVFGSTTPSELVKAVATDFGHVVANNFAERAQAIASEIASTSPDLIGLQEVSLWQTTPAAMSTCPDSFAITLDYLNILLHALSSRGLGYTVVVKGNNYDVQSPGLFSCGLMDVRLTDRNAILVRTSDLNRGDISISNVQSQNYQNNSSFLFFGKKFTFLTGWESVDVNTHGDIVRFISTHMDSASRNIRTLQARELTAGPMNTNLPVILSGDLNTVNTGSSFAVFASAGFRDSWQQANPGFTCCQVNQSGAIVDIINNPTSFLNQRVDYVLIRGSVQAKSAVLVGADPSSRTASGLWPSNHAGLVATIITPLQSIQQLIQLKHNMHLDASTNERLDAQLNAALLFEQHKINSGACGHLRGFVIQVQVALKVGHITQSEAAQLIRSAQAIETALLC